MFQEIRIVRLSDTDATGALYFTSLLKFAEEVFEAHLDALGIDLKMLLSSGEFSFPIVHAETSLYAPLGVSDKVAILQEIKEVKTSSFAVETLFERDGFSIGKTLITHVMVSQETKKSVAIPESYRQLFQTYL